MKRKEQEACLKLQLKSRAKEARSKENAVNGEAKSEQEAVRARCTLEPETVLARLKPGSRERKGATQRQRGKVRVKDSHAAVIEGTC